MTPKEFEIKVRELYGIPQDFDLESMPDSDLFDVLNGYYARGQNERIAGIATGNSDKEDTHIKADEMMQELLTELGYDKGARIIGHMWAWYA